MDGDDDEFDGTIGKNDEKSEIRPSIKICITRVIAVPQNLVKMELAQEGTFVT